MTRIHRLPAFAATAVMLLSVAGASPTIADEPVRLTVQVGEKCLTGLKPSGDVVKLTLRSDTGTFLGTRQDSSPSPSIFIDVCFGHRIKGGYSIRIRDGAYTRHVTVPPLSIAANRITDVVRGDGPASKHIALFHGICHVNGCGGDEQVDPLVNSQGRYHYDLSSLIDLRGADRLSASYANGHHDYFQTSAHVPYLQLSKPNRVHIECQPDRVVNVALKSAGGTVRATRSFPKAGDCATPDRTFRKDGAAVNYAFGNIIRSDLASDARVVWPHVSVSWVGNVISVRCLPSAEFGVQVMRAASQVFFLTEDTLSNGHYDDAATSFATQSGDVLNLICSTAKGDRITDTATVP